MEEPGDTEVHPDDLLSIQQVSRLLGVPTPTIRSWERRYGVSVSHRSPGGHRRYTQQELHVLRRIRDDIARGHPAVAAAARTTAARDAVNDGWIETFLEAAHRLDPHGVENVLDLAAATHGLGRAIDEVMLPAMRELGRWWEIGRCDVAHEHLASETTRSWLAGIVPEPVSPTPFGPVILSCGPRDYHTIGLDCIGALLRERGWECRSLGARVPPASLALAVEESNAVAVVLVSHLSMARRAAVDSLRSVQWDNLELFYAGNAFISRQARVGVPGHYLGTNLTAATELVLATITAAQHSNAPGENNGGTGLTG
ncbi:MAG: B12-binding domain-containing protein [Propionibacteriaceae bacterium]